MTVIENEKTTEIITDTGSPIAFIPQNETHYRKKNKGIRWVKTGNAQKQSFFTGRAAVLIEKDKTNVKSLKLKTGENVIDLSLGIDWIWNTKEKTINASSAPKRTIEKFNNLFGTNTKLNDILIIIKMQLIPRHPIIKKEAGPNPYHLPEQVEKRKETTNYDQTDTLKKNNLWKKTAM